MPTIQIEFSDEEYRRLAGYACPRFEGAEDFAAEIIRVWLAEREKQLKTILDHVLEENAELFRRLARGPE